MIPGEQPQDDTVYCTVCGEPNHATQPDCENCGTALPSSHSRSSLNTSDRPMPKPAAPVASGQGRCCPNCKRQYRPGELFCETCGADLTGAVSANSLVSRQLQRYSTLYAEFELETQNVKEQTTPSWQKGTVTFDEQAFLQMEFNGFDTPLVLHIPANRPLVFGRGDPSLGQVDIDLTPYDGHNQGISRHHAAVARQGKNLFFWDLGSTNGSSVNGARLAPNHQCQLRNGDEICLGQLIFRIYFQTHPIQ